MGTFIARQLRISKHIAIHIHRKPAHFVLRTPIKVAPGERRRFIIVLPTRTSKKARGNPGKPLNRSCISSEPKILRPATYAVAQSQPLYPQSVRNLAAAIQPAMKTVRFTAKQVQKTSLVTANRTGPELKHIVSPTHIKAENGARKRFIITPLIRQ